MTEHLLNHEDEVAIICATIEGTKANPNSIAMSPDKLAAAGLKQADAVEREMERPVSLQLNAREALKPRPLVVADVVTEGRNGRERGI